MIKLLRKEIQLAASPLSYFFIGFGLMAFVPGYPILVGSFFVCPWAVPVLSDSERGERSDLHGSPSGREARCCPGKICLLLFYRDLLFYIDRGRDADPYDFAVQRCGLQK